MEHLQHFGMVYDPFGNDPDLRFYYESASHRDAERRVERGLRQNKGLTVLTGQTGTGKTLLTRRLFEGLEEEIFDATLLVLLPGAADAQTVLRRFAHQLEVEQCDTDRATLLASIYERLAMVHEEDRHSLLIIDEAQMLSAESVAEVAALLGMEYEGKRMLSLLLVGRPELDAALTTHAGLHQRIDVRVELRPLGLEDTQAYLGHRVGVAGGDAKAFTTATVEVLYKLGRGRPRLINTLADNALFESYLVGQTEVSPSQVERAAGDLGIGFDPGTTYSGPSNSLSTASTAECVEGVDEGLNLLFDDRASEPQAGQGADPMFGTVSRVEKTGSDPASVLEAAFVAQEAPCEEALLLGEAVFSEDASEAEMVFLDRPLEVAEVEWAEHVMGSPASDTVAKPQLEIVSEDWGDDRGEVFPRTAGGSAHPAAISAADEEDDLFIE